MSEQPPAGGSGWVFKEIRVMPEERPRKWRSISFLTYATVGAVGLNALTELMQLFALAGERRLLSQLAGGAATQENFASAARTTESLIAVSALLTVMSLVLAYVLAGFWIYNAACNARALGARGFQNSPGWAVGWYAVPIASLFKPFEAMAEIYKASRSPVGWPLQKTPLLLRFWWGAWLIAGLGGYIMAIAARELTAPADLVGATQLQMLDVVLELVASALFVTVVLRVYRAQVAGQVRIGQVAQVFS